MVDAVTHNGQARWIAMTPTQPEIHIIAGSPIRPGEIRKRLSRLVGGWALLQRVAMRATARRGKRQIFSRIATKPDRAAMKPRCFEVCGLRGLEF